VSEQDEGPPRPADRSGAPPPVPGAAPPADPPDEANPGEVASRLEQVERQLAEFHRRAAHRESVIDRLHADNQVLRNGLGRIVLEPVVTDLIRLHDQLSREAGRLAAASQDAQLTRSFAADVAQILERCGIEVYTGEPGEPFDRSRHRPLAVVSCADESQHNTLAEVITSGFTERETGRVRRPLQARFYQYAPGSR
jgi:molecular chaperone GrpE